MEPLYQRDLAYIHAAAFGKLAQNAAPEIIRLLQAAPVPIRRVVDAGCGAGPLTAALVEAGFEVTGIDSSPELLVIARVKAQQANFIQGSLYETPLPACQAIVAVGEPLSYHAEPADADALLEGFFRAASAALPAGGMFIFDVIEIGEPPLGARNWHSGHDWAVLTETTEDQSAKTLRRNIETFRQVGQLYRRGREVHQVRFFETATLLQQLTSCGFSTLTAQAYGSEQLAPRRRAFFSTKIRQ